MTTEYKSSPIDQMQLTLSGFRDMQFIQTVCNNLYEEDYKFLEPTITFI